jgi:capsular polysaccharide biosynthesis protein
MTFVAPVYEAHTTLFIGNPSGVDADTRIMIQEFEMTQQLINDYKEILRTRLVAENVVKELNLGIPIEDLRSEMIIANIGTTRLFSIGYRDTNPKIAAEVANAFSNQLSLAVSGIVGLENIQIIDEAIAPEDPIGPSAVIFVIVGSSLGLLLGMGVVVNKSISAKKILQNVEDIEGLLGLPILAELPSYKMEANRL